MKDITKSIILSLAIVIVIAAIAGFLNKDFRLDFIEVLILITLAGFFTLIFTLDKYTPWGEQKLKIAKNRAGFEKKYNKIILYIFILSSVGISIAGYYYTLGEEMIARNVLGLSLGIASLGIYIYLIKKIKLSLSG